MDRKVSDSTKTNSSGTKWPCVTNFAAWLNKGHSLTPNGVSMEGANDIVEGVGSEEKLQFADTQLLKSKQGDDGGARRVLLLRGKVKFLEGPAP